MASCPIHCGEQTLLSFPSQRFLCVLLVLSSILANPSGLACWDEFCLVYDRSCYFLLNILQLTLHLLKTETVTPADTLAVKAGRRVYFFTSDTSVHTLQNRKCPFFSTAFVLLTHFLSGKPPSPFLPAAGPSPFSS